MRRYLTIASLLVLTAIFAVSYTKQAQSSEGVLSDHKLAQIFGGGESTGCKTTQDSTTCYPPPGGSSFICPDAGCQSVLQTQNFTGCSATGLYYFRNTFNTVQVGSETGNTKVATFTMIYCTNPEGCIVKSGYPVNDQKCVSGNCQGTYLDYKCRICDTGSAGNSNKQKNWSCNDP
jgi:hypothetical protein